MFDDTASSNSSGLSNGAKFAIVAAVPFIFLGIFFLIAPITELRTQTGGVFGCGSAIGAPDDQFKSNICGQINTVYMYRGLLSIAAGIIIAALGFFLFGNSGSSGSTVAAKPANATKATKAAPAPKAAKSAPTPLPDDFSSPGASNASAGSRGRARSFD